MVRKQFVGDMFEESSGSEFDMCPRESVDMRHRDGHCERLLRLLDFFRAHYFDPTSLVLSDRFHSTLASLREVVRQCAFGARWRKPTRLACGNPTSSLPFLLSHPQRLLCHGERGYFAAIVQVRKTCFWTEGQRRDLLLCDLNLARLWNATGRHAANTVWKEVSELRRESRSAAERITVRHDATKQNIHLEKMMHRHHISLSVSLSISFCFCFSFSFCFPCPCSCSIPVQWCGLRKVLCACVSCVHACRSFVSKRCVLCSSLTTFVRFLSSTRPFVTR